MSISIAEPAQQHEQADYLLVEQAYTGDYSAFEALVERYQSRLYRFASNLVGSEQAYDVVQFVLLQLYRSIPKLYHTPFWQDASLKSWLFRVTMNRCLDEKRRAKNPPLSLSELEYIYGDEDENPLLMTSLVDPDPLPDEVAERRAVRDQLREAIQSLPGRTRDVVWLRYSEDLTFADIGRRLSIPETTAKTYFYRARTRLRRALSTQANHSLFSMYGSV
jgi:RNA polymerase sigma-70 factor (ECF subfamily)